MPEPGPGPGGPFAPAAWPSRPLQLALAAIPLWFTLSILLSNVGWPLKAVVAAALGISLADPVHGLLFVAAIAPLGGLIAPMVDAVNFRIGEAVVVAFLGGWLVRALPDRRGPGVAVPAAGWLFAAAIAASIAGLGWQLSRFPGFLPRAIDEIQHLYFFLVEQIGLVAGARLLEGIGLAAATVILFRRRPSLAVTLPLALSASAAAAALSSVLLWRGIGSAGALERFRLIGDYRVSGHVPDVNAAGSYFAMIACLALGMFARARGSQRVIWLALAGASGVGLWFSASRSALGAAGLVMAVAILWAATSRFSRRARTAALVGLFLALLGGAAIRARLLQADPEYRGVGFREQFNATSLRMIGEHPLFGVGVGQYYRVSPLFLSPELGWSYGFENAHNYFMQIGGELGLVGIGLFAVLLGAGVTRAARAVACAPRDARLLGTGGGVIAYLVTCLTGHPFLVGEVAYPFWLQFGLMTALAGSTLLSQSGAAKPAAAVTPRARQLITAAVAIVILVAGPPVTAKDSATPAASQAVDGFYGWETLADGTKYRWTGEYASLFVPADVTRVYMPVRLPSNGGTARPMGVEVKIFGVRQGRTLIGDAWAMIDLPLPDALPPSRFKRIDLKVDRTWQPAVYLAGSADLRHVGVQVGELQMIR